MILSMTDNHLIVSNHRSFYSFLTFNTKFTRSFSSLVLLLPRPRFLVPLPAFPFVLPPLPLLALLVLHHGVRRCFPRDRFQRTPDFLQLRHGLAFPASSCLGWSSVSLRQPGTHQLPQRLCARLVRLNWRTSAEINKGGQSQSVCLTTWQFSSKRNGENETRNTLCISCILRLEFLVLFFCTKKTFFCVSGYIFVLFYIFVFSKWFIFTILLILKFNVNNIFLNVFLEIFDTYTFRWFPIGICSQQCNACARETSSILTNCQSLFVKTLWLMQLGAKTAVTFSNVCLRLSPILCM